MSRSIFDTTESLQALYLEYVEECEYLSAFDKDDLLVAKNNSEAVKEQYRQRKMESMQAKQEILEQFMDIALISPKDRFQMTVLKDKLIIDVANKGKKTILKFQNKTIEELLFEYFINDHLQKPFFRVGSKNQISGTFDLSELCIINGDFVCDNVPNEIKSSSIKDVLSYANSCYSKTQMEK